MTNTPQKPQEKALAKPLSEVIISYLRNEADTIKPRVDKEGLQLTISTEAIRKVLEQLEVDALRTKLEAMEVEMNSLKLPEEVQKYSSERVIIFARIDGMYQDPHGNIITNDLILQYEHDINNGEGILWIDRPR